MDKNELFLKTLFCCSACDGDIAPEEIELVKNFSRSVDLFKGMQVEESLNIYVEEINEQRKNFLRKYLNELSDAELDEKDQIKLVDFAIKMIEADNIIQYSEVKFFKKIRNRLTITDDVILEKIPNCEEYLLPDILDEDKDFEEVGNFAPISFRE